MRDDDVPISTDAAQLAHRGWRTIHLEGVATAALERETWAALAAAGLDTGPGLTPAVLRHSETMRTLLDRPWFETLLTEDCGLGSPLLSRCDGLLGPTEWQRSFQRIRRVASGRRFRPGIDILIPAAADGGAATIMECGHLLPPDFDPAFAPPSRRVAVDSGSGLLLEAGTPWRLETPVPFVRLTVVCGWIKPDYLHGESVSSDIAATMGPRARALCGDGVGYPTSIEDFLAIERAALDGVRGRAKGSGI